MFVAPADFPLAANLIESEDKKAKQWSFRERVDNERVRAEFNSPDDLATKVIIAIQNWESKRMPDQIDRIAIQDKSNPLSPYIIVEQTSEQFNEQKITEDENEFLFLEDIIVQLPTTNLTLVSLSSYFKLTGQSLMWTNIANSIISQLVEYCETPMLTFRIFVENVFCDPKRFSDNLKLLEINNLSELDNILKDTLKWGENVINKLFNEVFEQFLSCTTGSFDYQYNSYDVITVILLYFKRYEIIDNPKILEDLRLPFNKKIILKIIKDS
jgi:hypothetical protein